MLDESGNEIAVTAPPVETPPVATGGEVKPESKVDSMPDPAVLQAEIDRLKQVQAKAEEDARYWRKQKAEARAEYFKGRETPPPPPPADTGDLGIGPEPKQEAFDDYQKYLDSKIAYEVNKARVTWDREEARKQADTEYQRKMIDLKEKVNSLGMQEYQDFEEVFDNTVPITRTVAEALAESEIPHMVAYYLGKNRAEAIRLSRLNPIQVSREITKIEVEIAKAESRPSVAPKIPSAPPPIKPVGSSHSVEKPIEKMTQKEYEAWASQNPGLRRF